MTNKNEAIIKALNEFKKASNNLVLAWEENFVLDTLDALKFYPFAESFDEVENSISEWVEESIEEMQK